MAHGAALRQEAEIGDRDVIDIVRDWHSAPGLDKQDIEMLDFAAKVTNDAASCTSHDVDRLKTVGFSDQEILEIVLVCCWYSVQTRLADALGVDLDEKMRENETLVEAFAFGKKR